MATKIGINGFGRIGRCVARILFASGQKDIELVGINDLTTNETLAHLLKYDSIHRTFPLDVASDDESITIGGKRVPCSAIKDPAELPWKKLGADIVLECTGIFRNKAGATKHLTAGASKVIMTSTERSASGSTPTATIPRSTTSSRTRRAPRTASRRSRRS
jgi:glyceraldehyde 3-phosphate dehydrogenase